MTPPPDPRPADAEVRALVPWPDPSRPGVPLNPERDGDHWLCISEATGARMVFRWHSAPEGRVGVWANMSRNVFGSHPLDAVRFGMSYVAPCLPPEQVEAIIADRQQAAERERWQPIETAPRDERILVAWRMELGWHIWADEQDKAGTWDIAETMPDCWRALPAPPSDRPAAETGGREGV